MGTLASSARADVLGEGARVVAIQQSGVHRHHAGDLAALKRGEHALSGVHVHRVEEGQSVAADAGALEFFGNGYEGQGLVSLACMVPATATGEDACPTTSTASRKLG